jgi:hypothetical protein
VLAIPTIEQVVRRKSKDASGCLIWQWNGFWGPKHSRANSSLPTSCRQAQDAVLLYPSNSHTWKGFLHMLEIQKSLVIAGWAGNLIAWI